MALNTALSADENVYDQVMDEYGDRAMDDRVAEYARYLAENQYSLSKELPPASEKEVLKRASWLIEKEFEAEMTVVSAEDTDASLRNRARPGKPAISIQ
jgi:leucyl-tRNA synthetase